MQAMAARVLEQEPAIRQVLISDRKTAHLIPTWQDIYVLESLNKALSPLADLTDIISGEDYVRISTLKPLMHHITSEALSIGDGDTQLTKDIKEKAKSYLVRKYSDPDINQLLDLATFMDPRFRMDYTKATDVNAVKARVVKEAVEEATASGLLEQQSQEEPDQEPTEPPPAKKTKLATLLKKSRPVGGSSNSNTATPEDRITSEVDLYLQAPQLDTDDNPLEWWKTNHKTFPILAILAKKYLCICATSSASERVFSTSGVIVSAKRTCLKPAKVNMLVFLAKNL